MIDKKLFFVCILQYIQEKPDGYRITKLNKRQDLLGWKIGTKSKERVFIYTPNLALISPFHFALGFSLLLSK